LKNIVILKNKITNAYAIVLAVKLIQLQI